MQEHFQIVIASKNKMWNSNKLFHVVVHFNRRNVLRWVNLHFKARQPFCYISSTAGGTETVFNKVNGTSKGVGLEHKTVEKSLHKINALTHKNYPVIGNMINLNGEANTDLYKSLKTMDVENILELVHNYGSNLDRIGLALCMKNIHRYYVHRCLNKAEKDKFSSIMLTSPSFQMLVAYLVKQSPDYESVVVYDMVRFFHDLGFTSSDFPMRVYLQLCKYHIEDLYLDQLIQLASVVNSMQSNNFTVVLIEGLRALISHFDIVKFDSLNTYEIVKCLELFHMVLNEDKFNYLLENLWLDKNQLTVTQSLGLISCLKKHYTNYREKDNLKIKLVHYCTLQADRKFKSITVYGKENNVDTLKTYLDFFSNLDFYRDKNEEIRHLYDKLLLKVADYFASENKICNTELILPKLYLVQKLWDASLLHIKLIEHIISIFQNNVDTLEEYTEQLQSFLSNLMEVPEEYDVFSSIDLELLTNKILAIDVLLEGKQGTSNGKWAYILSQIWILKNGSIPTHLQQQFAPTSLATESRSDQLDAQYLRVCSVAENVAEKMNFKLKTDKNMSRYSSCGSAFIGPTWSTDHSQITLAIVSTKGCYRNTLQMKRSLSEWLNLPLFHDRKILLIYMNAFPEEEANQEPWIKTQFESLEQL